MRLHHVKVILESDKVGEWDWLISKQWMVQNYNDYAISFTEVLAGLT